MKQSVAVGAAGVVLAAFAVVAMAPAAEAFHGSWWRGLNGKVTVAGLGTLDVDFIWQGQQVCLQFAGGGCLGTGNGWYQLKLAGVVLTRSTFNGATEDVRNIFFTAGGGCGNVEVTPNYRLTFPGRINLAGRQEACLDNFPLGNNNNNFAGTVDNLQMTVRANGGFFPGGAPPVGAGVGWCCHG